MNAGEVKIIVARCPLKSPPLLDDGPRPNEVRSSRRGKNERGSNFLGTEGRDPARSDLRVDKNLWNEARVIFYRSRGSPVGCRP